MTDAENEKLRAHLSESERRALKSRLNAEHALEGLAVDVNTIRPPFEGGYFNAKAVDPHKLYNITQPPDEASARGESGADSDVKVTFTPRQLQRIVDRQAKTIEKLRASLANRPKRRRREVETMDYVKAAERFIRGAGRRVGEGDEHELRELLRLQEVLDAATAEAVAGQRSFGKSWASIGLAAGTSKEAAWQRWGKS